MKDVLLMVHDDAGQEARLQAALDLTRALRGHLRCVDVMHMPVVVDGYVGGGMAYVLEDERIRETANRAKLEPRLAAEDVSWTWEEPAGYLPDCLVTAAQSADLVVLNRKLDDDPALGNGHLVSQVVTHSRALVVAVSEDRRAFDAAGKALVGWDGSKRAMSTLQRAAPLLALASDVKLIQVGDLDEDEAIDIEEAAAYLSRHGTKAEAQIVPKHDSIAVELRLEAERYGAAYILMGAYHHSRVREALFGGVTKAMLTASSVPLILGH